MIEQRHTQFDGMRHAHAVTVAQQRAAHVAQQFANSGSRRQCELVPRITRTEAGIFGDAQRAQLSITPKSAHTLIAILERHLVAGCLLAPAAGAKPAKVCRKATKNTGKSFKPRQQPEARIAAE